MTVNVLLRSPTLCPLMGHERGHIKYPQQEMPPNDFNRHTMQNAKPKDKAYKLTDGGGMYLEVSPSGSKYWRLKYRLHNKEKRLAIGV